MQPMSAADGPLFELNCQVDPGAAEEIQQWLLGLASEARHEEDVTHARAFETHSEADGSHFWTCQFQCAAGTAVNQFRNGFLASSEAAIAAQFGDAVIVSSRVLLEEATPDLPVAGSPDCLNCGTRLTGQYCGVCGQRARSRLISLWELISDAFGDLLELDSRLWRTLIPLLKRPGRLTRDYLEGRRARYMPPFRTYLVLSVVFFVVAFFDPRDDLSLLFEPAPEATPEEQAEQESQAAAAKKEILDELAAEGIIVGDSVVDGTTQAVDQTPEPVEDTDGEFNIRVNESGDAGFNIVVDDDTGDCNVEAGDLEEMPEWFKRRFTAERIKEVCEKITADGGKSFGDLLLDNIPVALIVLLPLMALVLKVLYPLSRRYFVEHLLFVIHYHAFFFLILVLQILFSRLAALIHIPELLATLTIVATSFYIPVYLYMAMRHVYGQGRLLTFVKYLVLVAAYNVGTGLTLLGAVLFALVSV
jgi:hypothetical protein